MRITWIAPDGQFSDLLNALHHESTARVTKGAFDLGMALVADQDQFAPDALVALDFAMNLRDERTNCVIGAKSALLCVGSNRARHTMC